MSGKSFVSPTAFEGQDYSFCLFRIPKVGGRALWQITNSCNYPCGYCIFSGQKGKIPGELTKDEAYRMLDGLKSFNFTHIKYTGGEPFLRPDLLSVLERTAQLGIDFDISTNASAITQAVANRLRLINPSMVHVSLDGHTKELQELARGHHTYEPTIRGIQNLVAAGQYVRIGTVLFDNNDRFLEPMIQSAIGLGAKEIIFSYMEPVGRNDATTVQRSQRNISGLTDEISALSMKYATQIAVNHSFTQTPGETSTGACPAVSKFLFIDNFGRISPCTWVVAKNPAFRNEKTIRTTAFEELMSSEPLQNYLQFVENYSADGLRGCPMRVRS